MKKPKKRIKREEIWITRSGESKRTHRAFATKEEALTAASHEHESIVEGPWVRKTT